MKALLYGLERILERILLPQGEGGAKRRMRESGEGYLKLIPSPAASRHPLPVGEGFSSYAGAGDGRTVFADAEIGFSGFVSTFGDRRSSRSRPAINV